MGSPSTKELVLGTLLVVYLIGSFLVLHTLVYGEDHKMNGRPYITLKLKSGRTPGVGDYIFLAATWPVSLPTMIWMMKDER